MIFVTVGAQMPFERLINAVDDWARSAERHDVEAQIGPSSSPPQHITWTRFLDPDDFRARVNKATVIVGHAGMGTILTALQHGKPLLIMPRHGDLRETRNDHQIATALRFSARPGIHVAMNVIDLASQLAQIDTLAAGEPISRQASPELLVALRAFVSTGRLPDAKPPRLQVEPGDKLSPVRLPID